MCHRWHDLSAEQAEICGIEVERFEEQLESFENFKRPVGRASEEAIPGIHVLSIELSSSATQSLQTMKYHWHARLPVGAYCVAGAARLGVAHVKDETTDRGSRIAIRVAHSLHRVADQVVGFGGR